MRRTAWSTEHLEMWTVHRLRFFSFFFFFIPSFFHKLCATMCVWEFIAMPTKRTHCKSSLNATLIILSSWFPIVRAASLNFATIKRRHEHEVQLCLLVNHSFAPKRQCGGSIARWRIWCIDNLLIHPFLQQKDFPLLPLSAAMVTAQ